jgi:hypothetical protein
VAFKSSEVSIDPEELFRRMFGDRAFHMGGDFGDFGETFSPSAEVGTRIKYCHFCG